MTADVRLRLDLGYDGTDFSGWARQPGRRTVQGVLEDTLAMVLRLSVPVDLTVAGRTDAGVHARGQVAHADVPADVWERSGGPLVKRLNGALPPDLRVHVAAPAPEGFDARFSALSRRYAYRVCDDPAAMDPLRRHDVFVHPRRLDVAAVDRAARLLLGEHDFAAFCRRREGASTVRKLVRLDCAREPSPGPGDGLVVITVVADAFCHSMVRALVGALLPVGEGRTAPEWPAAVLAGGRRDPGVNVVAAHGLTLEEVAYPSAEDLAARAAETRRHRVPVGEG